MSSEDDRMSPQAAAERLGVSTVTLKRWSQAGHLTAYRTMGNHRRYSRTEVEALREQRSSNSHA